MKIAFVYDVPYPWHVGGIEFINYSEARELSKRYEVHFFTMKWPEMKDEFKYTGINYHTFHSVSQKQVYRHGRRSIREAIFFAFGLSRLFNYEFDVVVANQFPVLHLPMVKLYCKVKKCKLILEVAEVWDREYWNEYIGSTLGGIAHWLSNRLIKNADMYIVNSSTTGKKLAKLGVSNEKIVNFAPAIDNALIQNAIKKFKGQKNKTVLFSGRFIKEKRLDKWIDVVVKARKKDPKIRGVLIGNGPEFDTIKKYLDKNELNDIIELRPFYREKKHFYKELRESGLVLHMSEREGLGIISIESLLLGTPVLVPDYTPLPKEVKDMCVVESEQNIPHKIVEILNKSNKSAYIKNKANVENFLISNVVPTFDRIFRKIGLKE